MLYVLQFFCFLCIIVLYFYQTYLMCLKKKKNKKKKQTLLQTQPAHWPSGLSVRQWSGRPGFSPRSCHTKDFKNGI